MADEDYTTQGSVPIPGHVDIVTEGTHAFVLPNTTLSGTLPTTKSSNDGPLSRVEVNEGFVEVEVGEAVANERTAILEER